MTHTTARRFAVLGMILQGSLVVGFIVTAVRVLQTFARLGASNDVAAAAGEITGGVASALRAVLVVQPIGLLGLALMTWGIVAGRLRHRWVFRWARICMIPWILMIGMGTVIGITGLVFLHRRRKEFEQNGDSNKPGEPLPLDAARRLKVSLADVPPPAGTAHG